MIIDGITTPSGTVLDVSELDAIDSAAPKGSVLQVLQTHVTTPTFQTLTAGAHNEINGMTATITPTSATSKILVKMHWVGENNETSGHRLVFGLNRNGSAVGNIAGAGNRAVGLSVVAQSYYAVDNTSTLNQSQFEYLDDPATTSPVTYTMYTQNANTSSTLYTCRTVSDSDVVDYERVPCNIILMEIAQ